jgi:adenylate cyclase
MQRFMEELRRRGVLRIAVAYLASAWLLVQVLETLFPVFGLSEERVRWVVVAVAIGFVPVLALAWALEWTPGGLRRDPGPAEGTDVPRSRGASYDRVIIAILAIAVAYFALDKFVISRPNTPVAAGRASIAVLPFVDLSPHKDQEYFADGMSEELLNLLARIPQLHVASRTSSFSFKGKDARIDEISQALNVTHVLEGSVRKAGNQLRITAQLISTANGYHVWSETFDRADGNVFEIQDEIARRIASALQLKVLDNVPTVEPTDPQAHVLFLRGRQLERQRTEASMEQAVELLQQALEIDPTYANAWVALSVAYTNQTSAGLRPWAEGHELAREAALKALEIDPFNALGYDRLAWTARVFDANLTAAAEFGSRALALNPHDETILGHTAVLLQSLGRLDEAITLHERSVAQAPADATAHFNLALAYYFGDRLLDAERSLRKALALSPGYYGAYYRLGTIRLLRGDPRGAGVVFAKEQDEAFRVKGRALVASALRDEAAAQAALRELKFGWGDRWPSEIAHVYAYRNEIDAAFEWLEKDYAVSGPAGWGEWRLMRLLVNLHDDPRWQQFLEKVGASDRQLAAIKFEVDPAVFDSGGR